MWYIMLNNGDKVVSQGERWAYGPGAKTVEFFRGVDRIDTFRTKAISRWWRL